MWRRLNKEWKGCLQMQLVGYLSQQKYFTVLGVFTEPCFFSAYIDRNWPFMELFLHENTPPLCSSLSCCSLEVRSKDSRISGNKTGLFFTLNQRGDWERHSVRTYCSSVEKDLFLMHTAPNSLHCYLKLKLNTSGFEKYAEDEWLCSPVTVTWGPQSQVLWEKGSGTTAENMFVHIVREGYCKRGRWNVNRCPLQTNEFKSHLI